jgi:hypothetical protein
MRDSLSIFLRGFVLVTLVAWNVKHVASGQYLAAFCTATTLSFVWWLNAGLAGKAKDHPGLALAYGLGAGAGTILGMWLGGHV